MRPVGVVCYISAKIFKEKRKKHHLFLLFDEILT